VLGEVQAAGCSHYFRNLFLLSGITFALLIHINECTNYNVLFPVTL